MYHGRVSRHPMILVEILCIHVYVYIYAYKTYEKLICHPWTQVGTWCLFDSHIAHF